MTIACKSFLICILLAINSWLSMGFLQSINSKSVMPQQNPAAVSAPTTSTTSQLGVGNLFGGIFGGDDSKAQDGAKTILDIPTTNIKVGPLKFFLQIFLVGACNDPVPNAWVLNQNDENQSLDMYYTDGTGMFSIALQEYGMKVSRHGQAPSLQYQLQESILLHSLLDEVEGIAFAEDIEEDKRLIQFAASDALEKARETLPTRAAPEHSTEE